MAASVIVRYNVAVFRLVEREPCWYCIAAEVMLSIRCFIFDCCECRCVNFMCMFEWMMRGDCECIYVLHGLHQIEYEHH